MNATALTFWLTAGLLLLAVLGTVLRPLVGAGARTHRLALLGAVALPLLATSLYHQTGASHALQEQALPPPHRLSEPAMQDAVQALRQRLQQQPDDAAGWLLLARSFEALERWAEAADAYRQALRQAPGDAVLMTDLADVLATLQGGDLAGEPARLVDAALRSEPALPKAVALKAMIAYREGDAAEAQRWWARLADGQPPGSPAARAAAAGIARVQAEAGARADARAAAPPRSAARDATPATAASAPTPPRPAAPR